MAGRVNGDIEILVHAGAPSRGKDDAHYRALASAYLRFEPVSHQKLSIDAEFEQPASLDEEASVQLQADLQQTQLDVAQASPSEERDSYKSKQPSYATNFKNISITRSLHASFVAEPPPLSFSSCLDSLDPPALGHPRILKTPSPRPFQAQKLPSLGNDASWQTPQSVIADSQSPYNRAIPESSSPTRVLELYLQHFETISSSLASTVQDVSSNRLSASSQLMLDDFASLATGTQSPTAILSSSVEETIDIVLATPLLPQEKRYAVSDVNKKRRLSSPKRASLYKAPSQTHAFTPESVRCPEEHAASYYKLPHSLPSQSSTFKKRLHMEERIPDTQPRSAKLSNIARKQIPYQPITANEIHPPPPSTSSNGLLPPNITPDLKLLATQLSLPTRFQPRLQTRRLRSLERGYWSISMMPWESALRERVWKALRIYIAKRAKAGWGVWCARCEPKGKQNKEKAGRAGKKNDFHALTELRVYCWGEVVGHVYLLLHLVTERKIKGLGAKWIDGGGEIVIVMP